MKTRNRLLMDKTCARCGTPFVTLYTNALYCGDNCRKNIGGKTLHTKRCRVCGEEFTTNLGQAVFCNKTCQKVAEQERTLPSLARELGIPSQTVGALNELRVCVDLMEKGWAVFRAQSSACACDLVAFKGDGPPICIEVRTAYERGDKLYYGKQDHGRAEIFAAVTTTRIVYDPELP